MLIQQSTTFKRPFLMVLSSDHITGATGKTCVALLSKNGATQVTAIGTVTEIGVGQYNIALTVTDTNTLGPLAIQITATSCDATDLVSDLVVAFPTGTSIEAQVWDALRASHIATGTFGQANQVIDDGTAQAGGAATITLRAGSSATDNFYKGNFVLILSGTGSGQAPNPIASYVGATKVATVQNSWLTQPDNTSVYVLLPAPFVTDPWDEARSSHTTAGTFGEGVASVQGNITGTLAGGVNVTQWNGSNVTSGAASGTPDVNVKYVASQGPLKTNGTGGQAIGT